jgi:Mga helix-turn-helix domain.
MTKIEKQFLDAEDISDYMNISISRAYKVIHQLNSELKEKGYLTINGKVSSDYFYEKTYCGKKAINHASV